MLHKTVMYGSVAWRTWSRTARPLLEGMCLTVEPGVYFGAACIDKGLRDKTQGPMLVRERVEQLKGTGGVRLEDCVVVTADGIENLTNCPRTCEDVEAVMAGRITTRHELAKLHYSQAPSSYPAGAFAI